MNLEDARGTNLPVLEWIVLQMLEGIKAEVHVEMLPAQMMAAGERHVLNLRKTGVPKPRELVIGKKVLFAPDIKPNALRGYIDDFSS